MPFLELNAVSKKIGERVILQDIDFSMDEGRTVVIAGETGSGKTTLLKCIGGLLTPDTGELLFCGQKIEGPEQRLIPGHPGIAYLSQYFELRNHYRVEEELEYANQLGNEEAALIFASCRLDHLMKRYTHQLSGGEKQRIALARRLITRPRMLLLDEPYSNLDPLHKKIMQEVVQEIKIRFSVTVILVDHDPSDTLPHADEVLVLQGGRLVQRGSPQTVYREPASAYIARLFGRYSALPESWQEHGAVPFLRPEHLSLTGGRLGPLAGQVVQSLFYGDCYEAEVATTEGTLIVRHTDDHLRQGQSVSVFLR